MRRLIAVLFALIAASLGFWTLRRNQPTPAPASDSAIAAVTPVPGSLEARLAEATAAGPEELVRGATIMDWPVAAGRAPNLLRPGTNGWSCWPSMPGVQGVSAMCVDSVFAAFGQAIMARQTPNVPRLGVGYMFTSDYSESNTDPFATAATADNDWHHVGPHLMIVFPDTTALRGYPTRPLAHAPYVMFPGTAYGHLMVPIR